MFNTAMALGLVRHVLTTAAGYLAAKGFVSPDQTETIVSALLALAGVGWSFQSKKA